MATAPPPFEAAHTDSLIEQLQQVNQQLLAWDALDLDGIAQALERRGQLVSQVGHLLRDANARAGMPSGYRAALDQALEEGDRAIQRLLSLRQTIRSRYLHSKGLQPGSQAADPFISLEM